MEDISKPTKRVVELIETCCSSEKWDELAKQLNPSEVQWIADACNFDLDKEGMSDVLQSREGENWQIFIEMAFGENFDRLQQITITYPSKYSERLQIVADDAIEMCEHPDKDVEEDYCRIEFCEDTIFSVYADIKDEISKRDADEIHDRILQKTVYVGIEPQELQAKQEIIEKRALVLAALKTKCLQPQDTPGVSRDMLVRPVKLPVFRDVLGLTPPSFQDVFNLPNREVNELKQKQQTDKKTTETVSKKTDLREDWEKNMLNRAFTHLKNISSDVEGIKTAQVGKYSIAFQGSSQTLKISDSERGILYQAQKGQASTVCQFSDDEKKRFIQVSQSRKTNTKGVEHE